jgi:hypothetical protein
VKKSWGYALFMLGWGAKSAYIAFLISTGATLKAGVQWTIAVAFGVVALILFLVS